MIGSLAGVVIASKLSVVKRAYKINDQPPANVVPGYVEVPSSRPEENMIVA